MKFWHVAAFRPVDEMLDVARAADQAGFHGVMVPDHVFFPKELAPSYPYSSDGMPVFAADTDWPDSFCLISAMAMVTERVHFSNAVYIAGMRDLFTVARLVGTAAVISHGRVALGVGAGWMREEFEAFGVDFATRGRRLDEMVDALRTAWQGGWVEHHGEFFDFGPLRMDPAPPAEIPIWCGGVSRPALRRATTVCDGFIGNGPRSVDDALALANALREQRAAGPRADVPFEIVLSLTVPPTPDVVGRLEEAGVTSLIASPWLRASTPEERWQAVEEFGRTYIG